MVEIGKYNTLKIIKRSGLWSLSGWWRWDGDTFAGPLCAKNVKPGDEVEVFIYHDNEGRLIATTANPLAQAGEFQFMEVKSVNNTGAFWNGD